MKKFFAFAAAALLSVAANAQNQAPEGAVEVNVSMFHTWDGFGADAKVVNEQCYWDAMEYGTQGGGGAVLFGSGNVANTDYADLSAYAKLVLDVMPGTPLRVMINRQADNSLVELHPEVSAEGIAEVNITEYEYFHLNAIKVNWGGEGALYHLWAVPAAAPEPVVVNVAWPAEAVDVTGAEAFPLNEGLFQVVGNNGKATLTANGFYTGGNSTAEARHIMVFPDYDGTLTVEASASGDNTDRYVFVSTEDAGADENAADVIGKVAIPVKGQRETVVVPVTAGGVYYVCLHGNGTITNLVYTIGGVVEPEPATFAIETVTNQDAAAGEVESLLYQFVVTLPAGYQIAEGVVPTLNDMTGSVMPIDETTAAVRFMSAQFYTEAGDYVLTIPAGLFTVDGAANEEYTATWTVVAPVKTPWNITEVVMMWMGEEIAAGSEVETISYQFSVKGDKTAMSFGEGHVEFVDAEGNGIGVANNIAYGYLQFQGFGETGYNTPGTYTLVIPAGALVDEDGNPCEEFKASWTVVAPVVGINSVAVEGNAAIYNVSGIRVNAAKGLVIMNGKASYIK